jgi:hypothetical protein
MNMQSFSGGAVVWLSRREMRLLGLTTRGLWTQDPAALRRAVIFLHRRLRRTFGGLPDDSRIRVQFLPREGGGCAVLFSCGMARAREERLVFCFPEGGALIDAALRFREAAADAVTDSALYLRAEGYYLVLRPKEHERTRCMEHFSEYGIVIPPVRLLEPFLAEYAVVLAAQNALGFLTRYFSE